MVGELSMHMVLTKALQMGELLTGSGGTGKTSVSLALIGRLLEQAKQRQEGQGTAAGEEATGLFNSGLEKVECLRSGKRTTGTG